MSTGTVWIAAYIFNATQEIEAVLTYGTDKANCIDNAIAWFSNTKNTEWSIETRLTATQAIGTLMDIQAEETDTGNVQFPLNKDSGYSVAIMEMQEVIA